MGSVVEVFVMVVYVFGVMEGWVGFVPQSTSARSSFHFVQPIGGALEDKLDLFLAVGPGFYRIIRDPLYQDEIIKSAIPVH